jgi:hypothetical protein
MLAGKSLSEGLQDDAGPRQVALSRIVLEIFADDADHVSGTDPAPGADQLLLLSQSRNGLLGIVHAENVTQSAGASGLAMFIQVVAVQKIRPHRGCGEYCSGTACKNHVKLHDMFLICLELSKKPLSSSTSSD